MAVREYQARRAFLQGALVAPAVAALGAPVLAEGSANLRRLAPETPILRLYREYEALVAYMDDDATPSDEFDRLYPLSTEIEKQMEREPVTCVADLAAKILVLTGLREADSTIYEPSVRTECAAILAGGEA